ncbi:MAG: TonB-dependent receptor, partial [Luteibaculum sp.]
MIADYGGLEPRFNLRYKTSEISSIKAAVTRNLQYIHLASISPVSLPTDIWIPSSSKIKPQIGYQYAAGYFTNIPRFKSEFSVELYYKDMQNLVEYRDNTSPEDNIADNVDNQLTQGRGYSYGAEFFLKR